MQLVDNARNHIGVRIPFSFDPNWDFRWRGTYKYIRMYWDIWHPLEFNYKPQINEYKDATS